VQFRVRQVEATFTVTVRLAASNIAVSAAPGKVPVLVALAELTVDQLSV
jgi:hypothetical protein